MLILLPSPLSNIGSVEAALRRLGADYRLATSPADLQGADRVLLPGVGNCARALRFLRDEGYADALPRLRHPFLGICVGLQALCRTSEETDDGSHLVEGLGIFDAHVRRFPDHPEAKVPHMGWNSLENLETKLFSGVEEGAHAYYVHSFHPTLCSDTIATTRHGNTLFSAALRYENFFATQFHPEKSGDVGEQILKNFLLLK